SGYLGRRRAACPHHGRIPRSRRHPENCGRRRAACHLSAARNGSPGWRVVHRLSVEAQALHGPTKSPEGPAPEGSGVTSRTARAALLAKKTLDSLKAWVLSYCAAPRGTVRDILDQERGG